jgi:uncharacterized paraquat-inducible protein A
MNHGERYKLDCCHCHATVELPAGSAPEALACPRCGSVLEIDWRVAQKPEAPSQQQ